MADEIQDAERDLAERRKAAQKKALTIPAAQLIDHFNRVAPGNKCAFCGEDEYGIVPAPGGEHAGVVATPVPHLKNVAVWFFFATCNNCGHTIFFNAPHIIKALEEGR